MMTDAERLLAMLLEQYVVEGLLANALGYSYDPLYGFATGDHTIVTLAEEVVRRGVREYNSPDA